MWGIYRFALGQLRLERSSDNPFARPALRGENCVTITGEEYPADA
jgi:hypothetical protein